MKEKIMRIALSNGETEETVDLPMTKNDAYGLANRLAVADPDECHITRVEVFNEYLSGLKRCVNPDFSSLNGIAAWAGSARANDFGDPLETFAAVLEAKNIIDIHEALFVAENVDQYNVVSAQTAGEYGHYVLYESPREDIERFFSEEVEDYIDFEAYGKWRAEQDGAVKTSRGYVIDNTDFAQKQNMDLRM